MTETHETQTILSPSAEELMEKIRDELNVIPVPEEYWPARLAEMIRNEAETDPQDEDLRRTLSDFLLVLKDLQMYVSGDYLQKYCFSTADRARTTPDRYTHQTETVSLRMGTSFTEVLGVMFRLLEQGYRYEGTLAQLWNEALSGNMYLLLFEDTEAETGELAMFFRSIPLLEAPGAGEPGEYRAEADLYLPASLSENGHPMLDSSFWEAAEVLMRRNGKRSAAQILEYHTPC